MQAPTFSLHKARWYNILDGFILSLLLSGLIAREIYVYKRLGPDRQVHPFLCLQARSGGTKKKDWWSSWSGPPLLEGWSGQVSNFLPHVDHNLCMYSTYVKLCNKVTFSFSLRTLSRVWFFVFVLCSHNTFQMVFIGFMFPFMVLQNFHHVFLFICSVRTLIKSSNFECTFCSVQHALSLTILPLQKLGMRELRRFSKG